MIYSIIFILSSTSLRILNCLTFNSFCTVSHSLGVDVWRFEIFFNSKEIVQYFAAYIRTDITLYFTFHSNEVFFFYLIKPSLFLYISMCITISASLPLFVIKKKTVKILYLIQSSVISSLANFLLTAFIDFSFSISFSGCSAQSYLPITHC